MQDGTELAAVSISMNQVLKGATDATTFVQIPDWKNPVSYFVGRNGSGKTRAAKRIAESLNRGSLSTVKILSTDRLMGMVEAPRASESRRELKGYEIDDPSMRATYNAQSRISGTRIDDIYAITDHPEIWIKVAAFMRRALGRFVDIREKNGRIDPYIVTEEGEYSLLRDEGHGLREILILLTAIYRSDWRLLIVDEPELHLHPALARMWLSVLEAECRKTRRNAIIITHEPALLKPENADDLSAIWFFNGLKPSIRMSDLVLSVQEERITSSLRENPQLVSQLVFSPRPVLVEGPTDSTALSVAISRLYPDNPEVPSQTDFVVCGGCTKLALWFEIARNMKIDFRAVADLDALFVADIQRVMDGTGNVRDSIANQFMEPSPAIRSALAPISHAIGQAISGESSPRRKADWLAKRLADNPEEYVSQRAETLLSILQENNIWLYRQGTLEDVLGTDEKDVPHARDAASAAGRLDEVAEWAAFQFDLHGDISEFLRSTVESIAQNIQSYLGLSPDAGIDRLKQAMRPGTAKSWT